MVNPQPENDAQLINMVGAAALGLTDATVGDVALANGLDATAAAALVGLLDLARAGSVQRLSQFIGVTHSGAVRLVNRLTEAGLVERTPGSDARTLAVKLTRKGQTVARRIRDERQSAIAAALAGLGERERRQLAALCEVLIANLTSARLAVRSEGGVPTGGALCRMCDPTACGRAHGDCPAARTAAG